MNGLYFLIAAQRECFKLNGFKWKTILIHSSITETYLVSWTPSPSSVDTPGQVVFISFIHCQGINFRTQIWIISQWIIYLIQSMKELTCKSVMWVGLARIAITILFARGHYEWGWHIAVMLRQWRCVTLFLWNSVMLIKTCSCLSCLNVGCAQKDLWIVYDGCKTSVISVIATNSACEPVDSEELRPIWFPECWIWCDELLVLLNLGILDSFLDE